MSAPDSNEAIDAWFAPDPPAVTKPAPPKHSSGGMCQVCRTGWGLVFHRRGRPKPPPHRGIPGGAETGLATHASPDLLAPPPTVPQNDPTSTVAAVPASAAAADSTHSRASSTHSAASRAHSHPSFTSTLGSFLHALVSPVLSDPDAPTTPAAPAVPATQSKSRSLPQLNTAIPSAAAASDAGGPSSPRMSTTPLSASLPSVFRSVLSLGSPVADPDAADTVPPEAAPAAKREAKSAELIELEKALGIYTDDDSYALVTDSDAESSSADVAERRRVPEADSFRVELRGRLPTTKPICTPDMAEQLRKHFPALARLTDAWSLVYSMDQHGISLSTLYDRGRQMIGNKVVQPRGYVLVVQDSRGKKFGAFLSDPLRLSAHAFYGTGETFVFTYDNDLGQIKVYPWTGMNDFFIFGDPQYFAVGASDGKFAIWLDHELERGKSDPTITFDNPTLSSSRDFECYELELWGMST